MKQLLDFIPLAIFFALYKLEDIYVATGALIIATILQIFITYFIYKKVEKMQLVTALAVTVFGGLTIFFHDDNFIKWKVTIIYVVFAIGLATSNVLGKPALKSMLGKDLIAPDSVWVKVTWAWVVFFCLCAIVNVYVAFTLPLDIWVDFKVFGILGATLVFTFFSGLYIYKHLSKESAAPNSSE